MIQYDATLRAELGRELLSDEMDSASYLGRLRDA